MIKPTPMVLLEIFLQYTKYMMEVVQVLKIPLTSRLDMVIGSCPKAIYLTSTLLSM